MTVQILGSGCTNCKRLEANAREAVADLGIPAEIEKISEMQKIVEMGVMMTPALAVNGTVNDLAMSGAQAAFLIQDAASGHQVGFFCAQGVAYGSQLDLAFLEQVALFDKAGIGLQQTKPFGLERAFFPV